MYEPTDHMVGRERVGRWGWRGWEDGEGEGEDGEGEGVRMGRERV